MGEGKPNSPSVRPAPCERNGTIFHFAKGADYYYDRDGFLDTEKPQRKNRPSDRLGMCYRRLIAQSDLSSSNKKRADEALDQVISEVRSGEIKSFRMKIRGIHAEAFGGQEGGQKIQMDRQGFTIIRIFGRSLKKDVVTSPVETIPRMKHSAVFPLFIIKELVKLLCPTRGLVLDPYIGSGTTALAAVEEGRNYIGMDIEPMYCKMAGERLHDAGRY